MRHFTSVIAFGLTLYCLHFKDEKAEGLRNSTRVCVCGILNFILNELDSQEIAKGVYSSIEHDRTSISKPGI